MPPTTPAQGPDKTAVLKRLIVSLVCLIGFEITKIGVVLLVLFQYATLLITGKRNERVRQFSNRLSFYAYRVLRYATLNENGKPFPFGGLPRRQDLEPSARSVHF